MTFAEAGEQFECIPIHIYRLFSFLAFSYISAVKFLLTHSEILGRYKITSL